MASLQRELTNEWLSLDLIKNHKIFAGDLVQVVKGKRDVGKTGLVLSVIKNRNLMYITLLYSLQSLTLLYLTLLESSRILQWL